MLKKKKKEEPATGGNKEDGEKKNRRRRKHKKSGENKEMAKEKVRTVEMMAKIEMIDIMKMKKGGCMQKKLWRHLQREKIRLIINMLLMMKSKSQIHGELKINKVL